MAGHQFWSFYFFISYFRDHTYKPMTITIPIPAAIAIQPVSLILFHFI